MKLFGLLLKLTFVLAVIAGVSAVLITGVSFAIVKIVEMDVDIPEGTVQTFVDFMVEWKAKVQALMEQLG